MSRTKQFKDSVKFQFILEQRVLDAAQRWAAEEEQDTLSNALRKLLLTKCKKYINKEKT